MAARVAVALTFALVLQVVTAAPQHCSCDCSCVYPAAGPAIVSAPHASYVSAAPHASYVSAPSSVIVDAPSAVAYDGFGSYGGALSGGISSSTGPVPVGGPEVVSQSYGPSHQYVTSPHCQTSNYEVPVQAYSTAVSGPVSQSSAILEGYCSSSCAATRAKCGGTTKNISFKTPVIIEGGSSTSSVVSTIGAAVASRSTKAGTPEVSSQVYAAAAPAYSGAVASGPVVLSGSGSYGYSGPAVDYVASAPASYGYAAPVCDYAAPAPCSYAAPAPVVLPASAHCGCVAPAPITCGCAY